MHLLNTGYIFGLTPALFFFSPKISARGLASIILPYRSYWPNFILFHPLCYIIFNKNEILQTQHCNFGQYGNRCDGQSLANTVQTNTIYKTTVTEVKVLQKRPPIPNQFAIKYVIHYCRGQLKCDGTRAETRVRLSAKGTSPFKSAEEGGGASVQWTTGSRGVRISGSNAGYTMFRGSVKSTGYPLHSPVSPSLPVACVTGCFHVSTGLYLMIVYMYNRNM